MRLVLASKCVVEEPGALRPYCLRLATFRRKGRLGPGERRWVRMARQTSDALAIPRELYRRLVRETQAPVLDRRLLLPPVDFRWRGVLRPYQEPAAQTLAKLGGGVLVAAPGSGKTHMGLWLVAQWHQPALWIVHTLDLQRQAWERARALFDVPRGGLGFIGNGQASVGTHLTVAMVQTLVDQPDWVRYLRARVGTVVVDECHHVPAQTFLRVVNAFPARYRLGLSATPNRSDGLGPLMVAVLGPRVAVPKAALLRAGAILLPTVYWVESQWMPAGTKLWSAMERERATDPYRNALVTDICRRAFQRRRRILVLVEQQVHVKELVRRLTAAKLPVVGVNGAVPTSVRERTWRQVERGEVIGVATKLANEGLDLARLDCLVLAAAGRSAVRLEQQVGRAMRTAWRKADAEVWDVADVRAGAYRKHAAARLAWYHDQGFPVRRWRLTRGGYTESDIHPREDRHGQSAGGG